MVVSRMNLTPTVCRERAGFGDYCGGAVRRGMPIDYPAANDFPRGGPDEGPRLDASPRPSYVLVTAARNEEAFIEKTIESVVAQTVRPLVWVVVSDGSTDRTDAIVTRCARDHRWVRFLRMPERTGRDFAGKAKAFHAGYEAVRDRAFDIIGNLDADVSFAPDFFEFLLDKFAEDPRLGVAGTAFVENSTIAYDYAYADMRHVSGQCQLFRRTCFEMIGGYMPIARGAIDWVAVTTARMQGWETRTFVEKSFLHHRRIGTSQGGVIGALYRQGVKDYYTGSHPLWEVFRSGYRIARPPYVIGGAALFAGFLWSAVRRMPRPVSEELVAYNRKEQMRRLRTIVGTWLPSGASRRGDCERRATLSSGGDRAGGSSCA
jgi:glycosyltransferase involved in cell wall biosynthesis